MVNEESSEQTDVNESENEVKQEEVEVTEEVEEEVVEEETEHEEKVPYNRFKEKVSETNDLKEMVGSLVQVISSQNKGLTPKDKEFEWPEDIDPNTRKAVEQFYHTRNSQQNATNEQILGAVLDKLDDVNSKVEVPGISNYDKEISGIRKEYSNSGVYLSRKQAYEIAVSRGLIKKTSSGKVVVNKSKPVISKDKTNNNINSTKGKIKKPANQMTDQELEDSMANQTF
jgi:hypothetical protein